jgi:flavin-dependent dehydrogenase
MMETTCDVLVVGAGTTGIYFGWIMAKRGNSVIIIDREKRDNVGQRLEVIHLRPKIMAELGIPPPTAAPELICTWRGILVSRLPLFFQRMYTILEKDGAKLEFETEFTSLIFENGRIAGAKVVKEGKETTIAAKLVVDASGSDCAVRPTLPAGYGVDTWMYDAHNRFFVILYYIKWSKPDEPHPEWGDLRPYYYQFFDPGYTKEEAIMGIPGPESFEKSEQLMNEIIERFKYPAFEVKKKEYGYFCYSLPPDSLVGDGFFCAGDAASTMNYIASRGIPETWRICKNAEDVIDSALKSGEYVSRERLWSVNVKHFRNEGAELAYIYMLSSAIHSLTEKEIDFLLANLRSLIDSGNSDDGEEHEIKLTTGVVLKAAFKIVGALLMRKVSYRSLSRFIKTLQQAQDAKKHYQNYPESPAGFNAWKAKADEIWSRRVPGKRVFKTMTATYP